MELSSRCEELLEAIRDNADPENQPLLAYFAREDLVEAFVQVRRLDRIAESVGDSLNCEARLIDALNREDAAKQIAWAVPRRRDNKRFSGISSSYLDGDNEGFRRELRISQIRETLRDGFDLSETIQAYSEIISEYAREGDAAFFGALANCVREAESRPRAFIRNHEAWILRAWIPLTLWTCNSYAEGFERCAGAANLIGFPMPSIEEFETAWKNAKHRKRAAV